MATAAVIITSVSSSSRSSRVRHLESWAVADAVASLRLEHRRIIVETYHRGCSVGEASATLGIPVGTVKSRTFYALKALKLALQERGLAP
jgi:RNA polymerase sigma-70 factor (ECF subfamily)